MSTTSTTSFCGNILKTFIRNIASLDVGRIIHIILQLISFSILIGCLHADQWLSGYTGHQGLWNYCYKNGTSLCCGNLDAVLGYKVFIGATRVILIIECVAFLGIFLTIISTIYKLHQVCRVSTFLTIIIGFCTFLSTAIYGSQHGDVSRKTSMDLSTSFIFCASNLGLQVLIFVVGLCLCAEGNGTF
ncbi:uncharacterized protein LOC134705359 [Mytilus trossulus]|uniref:uncharacterized protein LOC134705359 n=1 Tax=Mytilus trossulus TaxID=6551 RepID=UPI003005CD7C